MIKLVYIAGPYRAASAWEIECNVHEAKRLGAQVTALGAYPIIPHANTSQFDALAPAEFWLEATLEVMRRCDAVLFTPDWQRSVGARGEYDEARKIGKPMFFTLVALREWLVAETARPVP